MQKRINISIDPRLHAAGQKHARKAHFTDFSGLITKLLLADLGPSYDPEAEENAEEARVVLDMAKRAAASKKSGVERKASRARHKAPRAGR